VDEWIDSLSEPQKENITAGFTVLSGFHPWAEATGFSAYFLINPNILTLGLELRKRG
jgi:hypothetical protein